MGYRFQPAKKKKMVRLKIGKAYVYVSRKVIGVLLLGTLVGFFALAAFLWWLWYVRIPELTGIIRPF